MACNCVCADPTSVAWRLQPIARMERTQRMNEVFVGMKWSFAALLIATLGSACEDRSKREQQQQQPAAVPKTEVGTVTEEPLRFLGKRVVLSGDVSKVYGPRAFELQGEGIWWDDTLLVLTRVPISISGETLHEDDEVTVAGVINRLAVADVERDIGWDLDQAIEVKFRDKPVLVADTISISDATATWSEKEYPQGTITGLMRLWTTPDPTMLAGQPLHVRDVPVRSKTGKTMWVGFNDLAQILVAPSDAAVLDRLDRGDWVALGGTVEKTPPAAQARTQWNLPAHMQAELARVPVYINATSVEKVAAPPGQQGQPGQPPGQPGQSGQPPGQSGQPGQQGQTKPANPHTPAKPPR